MFNHKHHKTLFINYAARGGGAEQFSADLFRATPNARFLVENPHNEPGAESFPTNLWSFASQLSSRVVRKLTRFRSIHHALGLHDSGHQTYSRLRQSEAYKSADLIHLNNLHGGWFDVAALAKIDSNKPVVWSLHDMWCMTGGEAHVFDHCGYKTGDWKTPYTANYPLLNPLFDRREHYGKLKKALYPQLAQTVFVPVSNWLKNCLEEASVYHPGMRIVTIKNGVDLSVFNTKNRMSSPLKKRVLFFNIPGPFKGSDIGEKALQAIEGTAEILVVGSRPKKLRQYQYIGAHVSDRQQLADLYRGADLMLFPSLADSMPLTILEAMACGAVVVAPSVGGIPEVVIDGETGFLAASPDEYLMTEKLKEATECDLAHLSKQAVEFIESHHDVLQMQRRYAALYAELMEENSPS